jgi:hypothetical protein
VDRGSRRRPPLELLLRRPSDRGKATGGVVALRWPMGGAEGVGR